MQKKPIVYLIALLSLTIAGGLSYFITGLVVKPKTVTIDTTKGLEAQKVRDLQPLGINITVLKTFIEITFNTSEKTFAYVYLTFKPDESFADVLKALKQDETEAFNGIWYKQQEVTPSTKHTFRIPLKELPKDKSKAYLYILLEWKNYYIPYGEQTSPVTGPITPWTINIK